jgi:hypothetical protein
VRQGGQLPDPEEYCGYQYHAAFSPDRLYDFTTAILSIFIEVDGEVGSGDVMAHGSFESARCMSGKACGDSGHG